MPLDMGGLCRKWFFSVPYRATFPANRTPIPPLARTSAPANPHAPPLPSGRPSRVARYIRWHHPALRHHPPLPFSSCARPFSRCPTSTSTSHHGSRNRRRPAHIPPLPSHPEEARRVHDHDRPEKLTGDAPAMPAYGLAALERRM